MLTRLWQRRKRWNKKPKVDPSNPNIQGKDGYQNNPWDFSTKNRDRPTGHTRSVHRNGYDQGTKKKRFFGRLNKQFFINEDL